MHPGSGWPCKGRPECSGKKREEEKRKEKGIKQGEMTLVLERGEKQ